MAHTDFSYLYPYSAEEARRRNELDQWRQSHRMNIACKEAIEAAISRDFDGMHLDADCAKKCDRCLRIQADRLRACQHLAGAFP